MKTILNFLAVLFVTTCLAQKDYNLEINGKLIELSLNEEQTVNIDGKKLKLNLTTKDTLSFESELFSFKYANDFKVSTLELEEGIKQVMLMTAEGSGVIIQEYTSINPTMLNEMMLTEVTKESLNYGYEMTREKYNKTLASGHEILIHKAVLTYKGDKSIYEVASIGGVDEGILIMTMISYDAMSSQGVKLINGMWNSLTYKSVK
jgi:hypothetical protein